MKKVYIVLTCIIVFLGIIAVINNPSKQECKRMVQQELIQKFIDNIPSEELEYDSAEGLIAITLLKSSYGEALCDALINVNVTNYIFFSTFEAGFIKSDDIDKKITGTVIFGNLSFSNQTLKSFQNEANKSESEQ